MLKAHKFFVEAIQLLIDLLGDADFMTLTTIVLVVQNLQMRAPSDVLPAQEIEELMLRTSNGIKIATGPHNSFNLMAKVSLAGLYTKSKKWTKAKNILTPIRRQREETLECQDELVDIVGAAKCAMASIYLLEGNLGAAETLLLELVAFCERVFTRKHIQSQGAIYNLASTCSELGWLHKARSLYEGLLSINRRARGESHNRTFLTIQRLAEVYRKLERYEDSLGLIEKLLPLMQEDLGRDDPLCISVIEQIAESLRLVHRYEEGVILREQALAMRRQRQGIDHVDTLASAVGTAACYLQLQRYDEALELLKGVVQISKRVLGDEHPMTLYYMLELADAHIKMDQVDVGVAMLQELLLLRQRVLGGDDADILKIRMILDHYASKIH